ncbi:MAG: flagellar motor switch protein FliM [Oscillospiraceae bacterium]
MPGDILSQSQIDALLNGLTTGEVKIDEVVSNDKKVKEYDFRTPKKFTKEKLKTISSIYETFARLTSSYLTGILRMFTKVSILQIEEQRYYEFNNALPDSVYLGVIDLKPVDHDISESQIMMDLSKDACFLIIDRLLGGSGEVPSDTTRDFTEIELALLDTVMFNLTKSMKETWSNCLEGDPVVVSIETNSRLVQNIGRDEIVVIITMELEVKGQKTAMNICLPGLFLEEAMGKLSTRTMRANRRPDEQKEQQKKDNIIESIKNSELNVRAVIGELDLSLNDILHLQVGDIIQLDKSVNDDVVVYIEKSPWFTGKLGTKKKRKAIRINQIIKKEVKP